MKRLIAAVLAGILLILSGCDQKKPLGSNTVVFYYKRSEYVYNSNDNVIVPEKRDLTSDRADLTYMLTLYMLGPLDEQLVFPFPSGTEILELHTVDKTVNITLSDVGSRFTDAEFSIAAACLSMTVFHLTECKYINITCGQRTLSLTEDSFLLNDEVLPDSTSTEEHQ